MRRAAITSVCILLAIALVGCGSSAPFVASKMGSRFHKPSCPWAKQIRDDVRLDFQTREEAAKAGKTACPTCNP